MFSVSVRRKNMLLTAQFPWPVGLVGFMAFPELMTGSKEEKERALRALAEDPFFHIHELGPLEDELWAEAKKMLDGKTVVRCLQPDILGQKLDIGSTDRSERRKAVKYVTDEIEKAAKLGLKAVAMCSGPDPGPAGRDEAVRNTLDSLRTICRSAAKHNLKVVFELFDRDYDRRLLMGPTKEAVDILRTLKAEYGNIGLLWDLSHAPMLHESPSVLEGVVDLLAHIHIGCAKKTDKGFLDSHPGFYTPGAVNGVDDVAELLKTLYRIGYTGAVSFEVKPEPTQTSLEIVNTAKGVLVTAYYKALESILSGV